MIRSKPACFQAVETEPYSPRVEDPNKLRLRARARKLSTSKIEQGKLRQVVQKWHKELFAEAKRLETRIKEGRSG